MSHLSNPTRRDLMKAGAGTVALSSAAGCIGDDDDAEDTPTDATDDRSNLWTQEPQPERVERLTEITETFTDEYGGEYDITVMETEDFVTEYNAALAAGQLFSMAGVSNIQMSQFWDTDIPAFDHHGEVIDEVGAENFHDNILAQVDIDRGYLGVPIMAWGMAMWYRQSAFDEHGLDTPNTWDSILEAAETLHAPEEDVWGVGIGTHGGGASFYPQQCYALFALANDSDIFDENGEIIFDSDGHIETLEYYDQLAEFNPPGVIEPGETFVGYAEGDGHLTPIASHILQYVWDVSEDPEDELADIRHSGYVEQTRQASFGLCEGFYMINDQAPEGAKERDRDFLSWWILEDDHEHYMNWLDVQIGGFQPVLEGFTEREEYRNQEVLQHVDESVLDAIDETLVNFDRFGGYIYGEYFPASGAIETQFIINDAVNRVVHGGESPQEVAEAEADRMRDVVEGFRE